MDRNPLVSIVIPVFNGANYLAEAINSAIAQSYSNIEILVINDGSNDNCATKKIALDYGGKIRYFEKENGGVATALNLGIQEMNGEYFSWLSHDDIYFPEKISTQISILKKLENKNSVLYSDFCYIDKDSKFIRNLKLEHFEPESFRLHFVMGGLIHGCSLLVPVRCFKECGVFNTKLRTTQDYDLWFRISDKFSFVHLAETLIQARLHDGQDTLKLKPIVIKECDEISLHFIKNIKIKEIKRGYGKPIPVYYFDFAKKMSEQGFKKAMRYAFIAGLLHLASIKKEFLRRFAIDAFVLSKEIF